MNKVVKATNMAAGFTESDILHGFSHAIEVLILNCIFKKNFLLQTDYALAENKYIKILVAFYVFAQAEAYI